VQPEPQNEILGLQVTASGDVADGTSHGSGGLDRRARCGRLRADRLGQEERDDAVTGVAPHEPTSIDHAPVGRASQATDEGEVAV